MNIDEEGSVAGIFLFIMLIIIMSLFFIIGGTIMDAVINSQNTMASSGIHVTQDAKDSLFNIVLLWKYGIPIAGLFCAGLWLFIIALRERSGYV